MLSLLAKRYFSVAYKGLERHGIKNKHIIYNPSVPELYEYALTNEKAADPDTRETIIDSTGAMCAYSGVRTGRSPKDKRVVLDDVTRNEIWWGNVNIPVNPDTNKFCKNIVLNYLNCKDRLFITDGYVGWDPKYRLKIRICSTRSYHALFMYNMLMRPTQEDLKRDFADDKNIDFHVFNAGEFNAPLPIKDLASPTSVQVNLKEKNMIILGTQYAGEMKKGVFGIMHYYMPKKGVVSLHSSATEGKDKDISLFFGLSGTGKTTLSADPKRLMLGDDEHCWSDDGIFNIEGGCYAKAINLSAEKEPDIYNAVKYGAVVENMFFKKGQEKERVLDFENTDITENTRLSYPLEHIQNAKFPSMGGHAKNIIFLTCDAFGVLPPIAKLTPEQAMYHFISGYTAKVAGTEVGIKDPEPTFSACFGEAFLPLHPTIYADMLADKMRKHKANAWLINTGWSGGKFGVGKRMSLNLTRKLIDAVHDGSLDKTQWENFPIFNFVIPKTVPGIDTAILNPKNTWTNKAEFDETLKKLATSFNKNFKKYSEQASEAVRAAAPKV